MVTSPEEQSAGRRRQSWRPHSGVLLSDDPARLESTPLGRLRDLGIEFVVIACPEDEVRWEAERLAAFTREVARHGLEGYIAPWGYGRLLDADPAAGSLYVHTQPQTLQIDNRGRRCPKACPNDPRYLEWFSNSMRTLAWLLEARGFLWDSPSFYHARGAWACHCAYCRRLFSAAANRPLPRSLSPEVQSFRRQSLNLFLLAAAAALQSVDRRLQSVVVPPSPLDPAAASGSGADDWRLLSANSGASALALALPPLSPGGPLPPPQALEPNVAAAHGEGRPVWLWLAGERLTPDREDEARDLARSLALTAIVWSDHQVLGRPRR